MVTPPQRQIEELNVQNQGLLEKLNAEESRRKSAEKSQVPEGPPV